MKKENIPLLLPIMLLPIVGLWVTCTENPDLMVMITGASSVPIALQKMMTFTIYLTLFASAILSLVFVITYTMRPRSDEESAGLLLLIKSIHLIPQVLILIASAHASTLAEFYIEPVGWIAFYLSLFFGGFIGYFLLLCVAKNGRARLRSVLLTSILQFVFLLDLVSILFLWLRLRKSNGEAVPVVEHSPQAPNDSPAAIVSPSPQARDFYHIDRIPALAHFGHSL